MLEGLAKNIDARREQVLCASLLQEVLSRGMAWSIDQVMKNEKVELLIIHLQSQVHLRTLL